MEINKKSLDKFKKLSDEVLRERDAVRKDLKRAESEWLNLFFVFSIEIITNQIFQTVLCRPFYFSSKHIRRHFG